MSISPRLHAYLTSWFHTSTGNKADAGVVVELTFDQFLSLFEKRQLASLETAIMRNRLRDQQGSENPLAYVLTWRSYVARSSNVYSVETAMVCSRRKSAKLGLPAKGDMLRPSHCENISTSLTGVAKTDEHCANISAGKRGQKIAGWSDERKAERRQQIADRKAAGMSRAA